MKLSWRPALFLSLYRFLIDRIDDGIYHLIAQRTSIARRIRHHKNLLYCPQREEAILRRLKKKNRLNIRLVEEIWHPLFHESKRQQQQEEREYHDHGDSTTRSIELIVSRMSPLDATWFNSLPPHQDII